MSVDDVIKSGLLNVIGLFSRDVIGWKTRVEFVNSHWSVQTVHSDGSTNKPDFITSSTDNYSSLDSEDDYRTDSRNVSHQQQFFSELHSPGRSHYTN